METANSLNRAEEQLMRIIRRLPSDCLARVIDFGSSLESRHARVGDDETEDNIAEENARWDLLLATDESQKLLEEMADQAWEEIQAGHARRMVFSDNGRIRDEMKWEKSFSESQDLLEMMADKAMKEIREGKAEQIGWDEL